MGLNCVANIPLQIVYTLFGQQSYASGSQALVWSMIELFGTEWFNPINKDWLGLI